MTGLVLGYKGLEELEQFYETENKRNIRAGLVPAFESRPIPITAVDCVPVENCSGLFLLPGHIRLSEYEVTLGISQELSGSIQTLANLPGSITYLIHETAKKFAADYVLIDMNPSLSSINQNLLMTSDFFMVPTSPDYFSVMALDSLATILPRWYEWAKKASSLQILKEANYPFPSPNVKFLGTVIQRYRSREGSATTSFQKWIDRINSTVEVKLAPVLRNINMTLPIEKYRLQGIGNDFCLSTISDFNSLIALSQEKQTPIFALTPEHIGYGGKPLERIMAVRDRFNETFSDLSDKIVELTQNDSSD